MKKLIVISMIFLVLFSCSPNKLTVLQNRKHIMHVELGMPESDVIRIMGPPKHKTRYLKSGVQITELKYMTTNCKSAQCWDHIFLHDNKVLQIGGQALKSSLD